MQLLLLGCDHRLAPLAALGAVREHHATLTARLLDLCQHGVTHGAVVVDTCNRIEILCEPADELAAAACRNAVRAVLGDLPLHEYKDQVAVEHLIDISTGVDSLVPGEEQILGQVTRAFRAATEAGMASKHLQSLCARVTAVARSLRHQRPQGGVPDSVAGLAARVVAEHGKRVAIVGAGGMARAAAEELQRLHVHDIWFVNRTIARAEGLAQHFHGQAIGLHEFLAAPPEVDGVILALGGKVLHMPLDKMKALRAVVDVSQPAVLDEAVRARHDLCVLDLDSLGPRAKAACRALEQWVVDTRMLAAGHGKAIWNGLSHSGASLGHVVELHVEAARDEMKKAQKNGLSQLDDRMMAYVATLVERVARRNAHLHIQDLKAKEFA
jgi:glutamyl-tRNA reductase